MQTLRQQMQLKLEETARDHEEALATQQRTHEAEIKTWKGRIQGEQVSASELQGAAGTLLEDLSREQQAKEEALQELHQVRPGCSGTTSGSKVRWW